MNKKEKYQFVINYFEVHAPEPETELVYDDPYQLLVAVILSAQCTDKRVNITTPFIFEKYPDVLALSKTNVEELFPLLKSISYPNNKTKHLIGMAQKVMNDFGGRIPMTVPELVTLPGVGRKTANVITSVIEKQPNMAVDTHVFRVSKRIGLVSQKASTPLAVEKELIKSISNIDGAKQVGQLVAKRAQAKGIKAVVFDRGGYLYHGKIKALADAAREAGLQF